MSALLEIGVAGSAGLTGTGCPRVRLTSVLIVFGIQDLRKLVQLNQKE